MKARLCLLLLLACIAACGSASLHYQLTQVEALRDARQLQLVVDTTTTRFTGDAFPAARVDEARRLYPTVVWAMLQEAFREAGHPRTFTLTENPSAQAPVLRVALRTVDSTSVAEAAGATVLGSLFGGNMGVGEAVAAFHVNLQDRTGASRLADDYSASGAPGLGLLVALRDLPSQDRLIVNAGAAMLLTAVRQFQGAVSQSLGWTGLESWPQISLRLPNGELRLIARGSSSRVFQLMVSTRGSRRTYESCHGVAFLAGGAPVGAGEAEYVASEEAGITVESLQLDLPEGAFARVAGSSSFAVRVCNDEVPITGGDAATLQRFARAEQR